MPNRRLPPLTALRAFEAVARHESFKKAADELCVTPGALSQQVRKLEEDLGAALLIRHNRCIEVTDAGSALQDGLQSAFREMRSAVNAALNTSERPTLTIGCLDFFASKWLVPRLARFTERHPEIDIRITTPSADETQTEAPDITVHISRWRHAAPGAHQVHREHFVAMMSPEFASRYRVTKPADLLNVPLIGDSYSECYSGSPSWHDWFSLANLTTPASVGRIDFGDRVDQAVDAAIAGIGVMLAPATLVSNEVLSGRLVCPLAHVLQSRASYTIACRRSKSNQWSIAMRDWLLTELADSKPNSASTDRKIVRPLVPPQPTFPEVRAVS